MTRGKTRRENHERMSHHRNTGGLDDGPCFPDDSEVHQMNRAQMPLSAVGMIAAHLFLDAKKESGMDDRQLGYNIPGTGGTTYLDRIIYVAACNAHRIARAVEDYSPQDSADPKE